MNDVKLVIIMKTGAVGTFTCTHTTCIVIFTQQNGLFPITQTIKHI